MEKLWNGIKNFIKKTRNALAISALCLLMAGLGFAAGYFTGHNKGGEQSAETFSLLPSATEVFDKIMSKLDTRSNENVSISAITGKLSSLQELSTYSYEYTVLREVDSSLTIFDDFRIPLTTSTIMLECDGVVKVGYDLEEIQVNVNDKTRQIVIRLPDARVNDNYVIWDQIRCNERASIFNPIEFDTYQALISDIEATGLTQAEEEGIYTLAENNLKMLIENSLAVFSDYEVVFE